MLDAAKKLEHSADRSTSYFQTLRRLYLYKNYFCSQNNILYINENLYLLKL